MTKEEINIAVAECLGWNSLGKDAETVEWWIQVPREAIAKLSHHAIKELRKYKLPDYLNNLDACKEIIEHMRKAGFIFALEDTEIQIWECNFWKSNEDECVFACDAIIERSICKAFLMHHKKWKE